VHDEPCRDSTGTLALLCTLHHIQVPTAVNVLPLIRHTLRPLRPLRPDALLESGTRVHRHDDDEANMEHEGGDARSQCIRHTRREP